MATEKQIAANRANALRSTGPKSEEGKEASRGNAVKHGMTSKVVLPKDMKQATDDRLEAWRESFQPKDAYQEFQLKIYVGASIQFENGHEILGETLERLAEIAEEGGVEWKDQCKEAALKIAKSLKRDPETTVIRLRKTPAGRALLIQKWRVLRIAAQGEPGVWTEDHMNQGYDLMGMERENRDMVIRQGVYPKDLLQIREWIDGQLAELVQLQAKFDERDERELRKAQAEGCPKIVDESLTRAKRYVSAARREMTNALKAFHKPEACETATADAKSHPLVKLALRKTNPISQHPVVETKPIAHPPVVKTNPIPEPAVVETKPIASQEEAVAPVVPETAPVQKSQVNWRRKNRTHRAKMIARQEAREAKRQAKRQGS